MTYMVMLDDPFQPPQMIGLGRIPPSDADPLACYWGGPPSNVSLWIRRRASGSAPYDSGAME